MLNWILQTLQKSLNYLESTQNKIVNNFVKKVSIV